MLLPTDDSSSVSEYSAASYGSNSRKQSRRQGIYWIATIPQHAFIPYLPPQCSWIKGQLELGKDSNFLHWQFIVAFKRKVSIHGFRECFGPYHGELTRSNRAEDYCWKEDTGVPGTRFCLGQKATNRASPNDWDAIWSSAVSGQILDIPPDIRIRSYNSFRRIREDYMRPTVCVRRAIVYWGLTGVGKSRRAWDEAGMEAYSKDPRTKFWSGYQGQSNVVIDEFRGGIDIAHILRWTDRYPVHVETKGGGLPLRADRIWFTSNIHPRAWYPDVDQATYDALERRLEIIEML